MQGAALEVLDLFSALKVGGRDGARVHCLLLAKNGLI